MEQIEKLLQSFVDEKQVAGMNLLVLKDGIEVLYTQAGYADIDSKKPYDRNTITRLYSMSKPITAAAAMILVERGIISLTQAVEEFLPGFQNQMVWENGKKVPVRRPVLIRELLNMTSGLVYGCDDENLPAEYETEQLFKEIDDRLYGDHPMSTIEIANRLGQCGLAFQPGDKWQYGTSADVMGAVIEVASGKSFGQFLYDEIFEPLGMKDTGFYVPEEKRERLATTYEWTKDGLFYCPTNHLGIMYTQEKAPAFESGGAGLVSTLDDYAKFAGMLLNHGTYCGVKILEPSTVDFLTNGTLLPWQKETAWRTWDTMAGYNYGNFMRKMEEPGMAYYKTWEKEYGWDGWLGAYFCNSPKNNVTILMGMQLKEAGNYPIIAKMRNVVADLTWPKTYEQMAVEYHQKELERPNAYELEKFPILDGKKHPFAVICPGGGYRAVCTCKEGYVFARELNKNGIAAFVVNYRVQEEAKYPQPMEDLARAVKEIFAQADKLCLDTDNYSVWGASAGGHLAASFGTKNMGYMKYNLPKPKAIVLAYPVITMGALTHLGSKEHLIGEDASEEMINFTSIEKQVTEDYPATFVFHGADDQTVPVENSRMLAKALKEADVPYEYVEYPGIIHGVGIAKGLICEDWFERALSFWRNLGISGRER